jgi:hypothetical protein
MIDPLKERLIQPSEAVTMYPSGRKISSPIRAGSRGT